MKEKTFLKRLGTITPFSSEIKLFRVQSWKNDGYPNCVGALGRQETRKAIKKNILGLKMNRKKMLKEKNALKNYNTLMSEKKTKTTTILASILKLNNPSNQSEIVFI